MFATNPFSILAETVPSVVMQGFVVLMVLLIYHKGIISSDSYLRNNMTNGSILENNFLKNCPDRRR